MDEICPHCGKRSEEYALHGVCPNCEEYASQLDRTQPFYDDRPSKAIGGGMEPYDSDFGRLVR